MVCKLFDRAWRKLHSRWTDLLGTSPKMTSGQHLIKFPLNERDVFSVRALGRRRYVLYERESVCFRGTCLERLGVVRRMLVNLRPLSVLTSLPSVCPLA
jgi:hypothetical protein